MVRIPEKKPGITNDILSDFWDNLIDAIIVAPFAWLLALILGGDAEDWDTREEIAANLIPALIRLPIRTIVTLIGGIPVIGDAVEDAFAGWLKTTNETAVDAQETVVNVGTQVSYVQHIIGVQSGMGVWETGPDRTGTPSFPFAFLYLHTHTVSASGFSASTGNAGSHIVSISGTTGSTNGHTHTFSDTHSVASHNHSVSLSGSATTTMDIPTIAVTSTWAPWGNVIFKSAAERKVVTWLAYKTGTVTGFYFDLYQLESDGSSTLVYSSPNLAGDIPVTSFLGWMQFLMDQTVVADMGDSYDVQFRMTGSGTVYVAGINLPYPTPLPGFRPYAAGSGRNPSSNPAPATIDATTRDAMYTGPCPFVSIGIDVGQTELPRFFFDDFNRGSFGSQWKRSGGIKIENNRVQNSPPLIGVGSGAIMYVQPLASDYVEVGFDVVPRANPSGAGACCNNTLGAGVWFLADEDGVYIETGAYNSRTRRATGSPVSGGRLVGVVTPGENPGDPYVYTLHPGTRDNPPLATWADTGNVVAHGIGRRWLGINTNGSLINGGSYVDNWTAADIVAEEE